MTGTAPPPPPLLRPLAPNESDALVNMAADRERELRRINAVQMEEFRHKLELTAARNPTIDPKIFHAILDRYREENVQFINDLAKAHHTAPFNQAHLNTVIQDLRIGYYRRVRDKVFAEFPAEAEKAMNAISRQLQPDSIFKPLVQCFINTERMDGKAGVQTGGLVGGLGFAAIAYYMTKGAGWLVTTLATLGALLLGGFMGNRLIEGPEKPPVTPDFSKPRAETTRLGAITPPPTPAPAPPTSTPTR